MAQLKYLTKSDVEGKLSVPEDWLGILPKFGEGRKVVVRALDGEDVYWEFDCVIRRGPYKKPVFQSREWLKFVKWKGLTVGDMIVLCEEENVFRGTKYRIRAQRSLD